MNTELKKRLIVSQEKEEHFKVIINGKEVFVSKYVKDDEFGTEGDTEIFKGKELLTEEEQEEVLNFVDELD